MTKFELLQFSAKSIGYTTLSYADFSEHEKSTLDYIMVVDYYGRLKFTWNPLKFKDQALDLIFTNKIQIQTGLDCTAGMGEFVEFKTLYIQNDDSTIDLREDIDDVNDKEEFINAIVRISARKYLQMHVNENTSYDVAKQNAMNMLSFLD